MSEFLKNLKATDLNTLTLNAEEDSITASYYVLVGSKGEVVEYEEVVEFGKDQPSIRVKQAATELAAAMLEYVQKRVSRKDPPRCLTCISACCTDKEGLVRVTESDVARMRSKLGRSKADDMITFYGDGTSFTGYCGELKRVELPEPVGSETRGCLNLTDRGCGIYDARPEVCRDYSSYVCGDMYEEDEKKLVEFKNGKHTLLVKD